MPPATVHPAPAGLLAALRAARAAGPGTESRRVEDLGLRPLAGGRNNHVYSWDTPRGATCIKVYKADGRGRDEREWEALTLLAGHAVPGVPAPLWRDPHQAAPAIGMTIVPGTSLPDLPAPEDGLDGLADIWARIARVPLAGPLARLTRVDSAAHYAERISVTWAGQLSEQPAGDPLTRDLARLLDRWRADGDAAALEQPEPPVLSRGDANLLNWLHDPASASTGCVDWEFSGASDQAFDAADLTEHVSGRIFDDETWSKVIPVLGVATRHDTRRFYAAQRTCALRWLAVLWRQRAKRAEEFQVQFDRVRQLQDRSLLIAG